MTLSGPDEHMMFLFKKFVPFFVICVNYLSNSFFSYVFVTLSLQKLHDLGERNISIGFNCKPFVNCSVSKQPGKRFRKIGIFIIVSSSTSTFTLHVEILFFDKVIIDKISQKLIGSFLTEMMRRCLNWIWYKRDHFKPDLLRNQFRHQDLTQYQAANRLDPGPFLNSRLTHHF